MIIERLKNYVYLHFVVLIKQGRKKPQGSTNRNHFIGRNSNENNLNSEVKF